MAICKSLKSKHLLSSPLYLLKTGFQQAFNRPKLILGVYAVQTLLAFLLSQPLFDMLNAVTASSAFVPELLSRHSAILWTQIFELLQQKALAWLGLLLGVLPAIWLFNNLSKTGIACALDEKAEGSFWKGIRYFGFKSLALGVVFFSLFFLWTVLIFFFATILMSFLKSEVWIFWILLVFVPFLWITGIALLNLFHDYARCYLLQSGKILASVSKGIKFPFKFGQSSRLYIIFFVISSVIFLLVANLGNFWMRSVLLFMQQGVQNAWLAATNRLFAMSNEKIV